MKLIDATSKKATTPAMKIDPQSLGRVEIFRPSKYYPNIQFGGVFVSLFLAGFCISAIYGLYPPIGTTMGILVMIVLPLLTLIFLLIAIYYLSDIFLRAIIITDNTIVDRHGFIRGKNVIPLSAVTACRLDLPEKEKSKPGLELVQLSWWDRFGGARSAYSGVLRGYAKKQSISLLGKRNEIVGRIDCFGFEDQSVKRLIAILNN